MSDTWFQYFQFVLQDRHITLTFRNKKHINGDINVSPSAIKNQVNKKMIATVQVKIIPEILKLRALERDILFLDLIQRYGSPGIRLVRSDHFAESPK